MLHLLQEYAQKHLPVPQPGFKSKQVRWSIAFSEAGDYLDVVELGDVGDKRNPGQTFTHCPEFTQPAMKFAGIAKSHFLVESVRVAVLYGVPDEDEKTVAKHQYFLDQLRRASTLMPILSKLAHQLESEVVRKRISRRLEEGRARMGDKVTVLVGSWFPVASTDWHPWWEAERAKYAKTSKSTSMRSYLSGRMVEPALTHGRKIDARDVGGNPVGSVLIGFDKAAFESFGLPQSFNAAVAEVEVYAYADALNHIFQTSSYRVAGTKIGYWFKERVAAEDDPLAWLVQGDEQEELSARRQARKLLDSIRSGQRADLSYNHFYAITVSGMGGRVMVRDWMEGHFERLVQCVDQWFDDLTIVNMSGARTAKNPGLERVVTCLLPPRKPNQKYENWIKSLGSARVDLWRAAVRGDSLPWSCMARIINAHRVFCATGALEEAEKTGENLALTLSVLYARMGLLKAYHVRQNRIEGKEPTMQPYLNEDHPHPAYHCGRLLAVLASLQRSALGDVGAGVVQRYFTSAAATPALVLGRITATSQHHLAKLEGGLRVWYERKIADIWSRLKDSVPGTLTLEEQSLFALGYYQQLAAPMNKSANNNVTENSHE